MVMTKPIAIDTGPLILLAKADLLPMVAQLPYRFIAPQEVMDELKTGDDLGYQVVNAPWLDIKPLQSPVPEIIRATLDKGEAAVIQLALETDISHVCIDDLRGRRIAKAVGLEVIGILGLLGKAKRQGLIPAVAPLIDKLIASGAHYSPELTKAIIDDVDGR
ncbi:MAG: DUF3368 domain-containing protein [Planctomycetaceae bacterium]|nr:DUF3368 domain-containing protein [Planctomycetaceae bacterium]